MGPEGPLQFPKARTWFLPTVGLCSSPLIFKAFQPAWRMPGFLCGSLAELFPSGQRLDNSPLVGKANSDSSNPQNDCSMPLKKTTKPTVTEGLIHGFDQARLDHLTASMQPLLTRNAMEEELEALLKEAEDCLKATTGGKTKRLQGWWARNTKTTKMVKTVSNTGIDEV
ncbi:hypothetical protein QR685DRAFT_451420 [Neurospora intermedia]|uniref:Uncharacterized protein n=1 Tax=Neurospora intermedia TaxID=5142 RepID=A0ABR3D135_NEUIN